MSKYITEEQKEKHRKESAEWKKNNHDKYVATYKKYAEVHKEELRERDRKRSKEKKQLRINRRKEFFADKVCSQCETTQNLCLHHVDPKTKIGSSDMIWEWVEEKRQKEIAKCIVVCNSCHQKIHYRSRKFNTKGQFLSHV